MINSGNTYITEIHYQGYTIKKVYACNGELVWGEDGLKYKGEYNNGEVFTLNCDGDPEITMMDVQIDAPSIANLSAATFYPCAEYLGYEVLSAANNLKRVEMLEGVKSIGQGAFDHSSALTEVIIPDSVKTIGSHAFENCDKISALTIGSGVTTIGQQAFSGCSSLDNDLDFPNIDRINTSAFRGCSKLKSVNLGSGCTRIEGNAFTNCTGLTSITVNAIAPPYCAPYAFENTNNCPIYVPCESADTYKTTYAWNSYASRIVGFECKKWTATYEGGSVVTAECDSTEEIVQNEVNTSDLVSIEIGNCVTGITYFALYNSYNLTSVTLSNSVTYIGQYVFMSDSSLTSINIPDSVTRISDYAFFNCTSLPSITIGSGITQIDGWVFMGCDSLSSVTINATTPPTLGEDVFKNTDENLTIYVPSASVNAYKAASGWSDYADIIQPIT